MKKSDGRSTSRLARALGLIIVLGLPLAAAAPLEPGFSRAPAGSSADQIAASSGDSAAAKADPIDGYTPAAPIAADDADTAVEVRQSTPPGAKPVTTVVNDPRCGPGFTSSGVAGSAAFACFHSALDPLPEIGQPMAKANAAAPVCIGNGVNGPRIQLLYMYVEGQPNRSALMVPRIVNEFAPRMDAVFRETSKLQGREIGMRLHMPGCQLVVDTVTIDADNGAPDDPNALSSRITDRLVELGYTSTDRKYVLWFDGGNKGACGIAPALTPLLEQGYNPTPATSSNIGWQAVLPETAIIFRYGQPILGDAYGAQECWGRGGTGARTEIHELIHLLGAVNLSAPNSNGFGHCTDDHDIMCYGEQGVSTVPRCATPVEQLDCGADDYFNARPAAGSYLSTHWNTANSKFLGDAIVHDAVPVEIPRP